MRILVFGDSVGQGCWDAQGGWVHRLSNSFRQQTIRDLDFGQPTVFNLSIDGDSSTEVVARFRNEVDARRWPGEAFIIVFTIGSNDTWILPDRSSKTNELDFAGRLRKLAEMAGGYAPPQRVLFVGLPACDESRTMPVSWVDLSFTNERLKSFETAIANVAADTGVLFVPVFDKFLALQATTNLLIDGLHPNDAGHELIFKLVKPVIDGMLRRH